jgi:very-short-patch-repair endonuclease
VSENFTLQFVAKKLSDPDGLRCYSEVVISEELPGAFMNGDFFHESLSGNLPPAQDRVLVAVLPTVRDFEIVREKGWYRIPIEAAQQWIGHRWPPQWIAFYYSHSFGRDAFSIRYYAKVIGFHEAGRHELFPDELLNEKSDKRYYRVLVLPLQRLPRMIRSRSERRIVFIRTSFQKLMAAKEVNDLYDESPVEDWLWQEIKKHKLKAERQEWIKVGARTYALDFAFYCKHGKLDVETDGDWWHCDPARAAEDNLRDSDLEADGWRILRFNTYQLRQEAERFCVPTIIDEIKKLNQPVASRVAWPDVKAVGLIAESAAPDAQN